MGSASGVWAGHNRNRRRRHRWLGRGAIQQRRDRSRGGETSCRGGQGPQRHQWPSCLELEARSSGGERYERRWQGIGNCRRLGHSRSGRARWRRWSGRRECWWEYGHQTLEHELDAHGVVVGTRLAGDDVGRAEGQQDSVLAGESVEAWSNVGDHVADEKLGEAAITRKAVGADRTRSFLIGRMERSTSPT